MRRLLSSLRLWQKQRSTEVPLGVECAWPRAAGQGGPLPLR